MVGWNPWDDGGRWMQFGLKFDDDEDDGDDWERWN